MEIPSYLPKSMPRGSFVSSYGCTIELNFSNQILKINRLLEKKFIAGLDKIKTKLENERKAFRLYVDTTEEFKTEQALLYTRSMVKTDNLLNLYKNRFYAS